MTSLPAMRHGAQRIRHAWKFWLSSALLWALLIFLAVPFDIFTPPAQTAGNPMAANTISRLIKLSLLGIAVVIIAGRLAILRALIGRLNIFFKIFLCLVPVSYLWSISPPDTFARYVSILSTLGVCVAFCVGDWNRLRFQSVLRPFLTLLLAGSVIFVMVAPDLAIEHGIGTLKDAWHGLVAQKNPFGELASFGVIFWLHATLSGEVKPWKGMLGGALSLWCVIKSRSSTSLLSTVFVTLFLLMLMRSPAGLRRYMPYLVALFAILVITYALAVLNLVPGLGVLLEPITMVTGKDMTFSNRSEIWAIIKEHIDLRPLLGSGYGAYWTGPVPSSESYVFLGRMYFYPTESHDGYLEIVNDLGFVGLICLIGYLATYIRQALRLLRTERAQGALFLALFFQQAIMNLSESCWLAVNSGFVFAIMTFATVALARALLEQEALSRSQLRVQVPPPPFQADVRRETGRRRSPFYAPRNRPQSRS